MANYSSTPLNFAVFNGDLDKEWAERFAMGSAIAVDTEAMGLIHGRDRLCLIQICDDGDNVACIKIDQGQKKAPRFKARKSNSFVPRRDFRSLNFFEAIFR